MVSNQIWDYPPRVARLQIPGSSGSWSMFETQTNLQVVLMGIKSMVSDLVLRSRPRLFQSRNRSQSWDSENTGLGLETETQKITLSD